MTAPEQQLLITEDQIIAPAVEVLKEVAPINVPNSHEVSPSLKQSLDNLFPEQQYDEKSIQKAKEILGDIALELSEEQLKDAVTEIQFLAESWLDDFERKIFKGMTLQEVLHEKGGV
jgi:hypothetical protein